MDTNSKVIDLAIDGFTGSGKTFISKKMKNARVLHTDDFFYPEGYKKHPLAGNFDVLYFIKYVLPKLKSSEGFFYNSFDCKRQKYIKKYLKPGQFTVLEGSFSSSPLLKNYVKNCVFLVKNYNYRKNNLIRREKKRYEIFLNKWGKDEYNYYRRFKNRILKQVEK